MRRYSIVVAVIILFLVIAYENFKEIESALVAKYLHQTALEIENEIRLKLSTTMALGIATSQDGNLQTSLLQGTPIDLRSLTKKLRRYTIYKNIHYKLLDREGNIRYATLPVVFFAKCTKLSQRKTPYQSDIVMDCYGLHFASFVPIETSGKIEGYLETMSQFNSIMRDLQRFGTLSVALLDKSYFDYAKKLHKQIQHYKILNKEPDEHLLHILYAIDLDRLLQAKEPLERGGMIIYRYPVKNMKDEIVGWIVYAKPKSQILTNFISTSVIYRIVIIATLFALAFIVLIVIFEREKHRQKQQQLRYFYNILDKLQEIVVINDGKRMRYANAIFFKYFDDFSNLEQFLQKHACICDFFVQEEGFLSPIINGKKWTEYLLEHKNRPSYVKIRYKEKEYIFQVKANRIDREDFVVIFIDVTQSFKKQQLLQHLAIIDPLTKLYNRYFFEKIANEKIEEAAAMDNELLFAMIDIDYFKSINDTYGHDKGDLVLKDIAAILRNGFRKSDPIFRIGGEEFLILLQTSDVKRVLEILEELRQEVARHTFNGIERNVTISIGVAKYKEGDTVESLYKRADQMLYKAKRSGRNRLIYEGEEDA